MKRILMGTGVFLLMAAIGVGIYFVLLVKGIGGVDDWTVRKVVNIVNNSLEPQLSFDSVSLQVGVEQNEDGSPYAIRFEGATLTAPDGTRVVSTQSLRVALASFPKRGQPVSISNITLESPEIRIIRELNAEGETVFQGLVPFVKPNPTQRDVDPDTEGTTTLSDVLDLRRFSVTNASIHYENRARPDFQPMKLAGIGFDLESEPERTASGQLLHTLDVAFGKFPIFDLSLKGKVDLDNLRAQVEALEINADLEHEEAVSALTPQLQSLVNKHEIRGLLGMRLSGNLDLQQRQNNDLRLSADLTDGNFAAGEYRLPVPSLRLEASLKSMVARVDSLLINTLAGVVRVEDAHLDLMSEGQPFYATWALEGIQLRDALRSGVEEDPTMAGLVSGTGHFATRSQDFISGMTGNGSITIREGRLINIPVLSNILAAADLLGSLKGKAKGYNDTLDSEFRITPPGLDLTSLKVVVPVAKFSGTGLIGYNGKIDLRMRGGAVEKIPVLGDIAGAVTGKLVEYRILKEPGEKVNIRLNPLGIGD